MSTEPIEYVPISISIPKELLTKADARAFAFGITRSRYLSAVLRADVVKGGPLTLPDSTPGVGDYAVPSGFGQEDYDFLLYAIPELDRYERSLKKEPAGDAVPVPPNDLVESRLWRLFLLERDEILRYKWLESEKAGYDIGLSRALREWLQAHRPLWLSRQPGA